MRGERRPPVLRAAMADPGEKKYIKKKIRPGAIVLDPRETAIVVQYELEGQLLAPDGVTVITELSDGTKRIKVKTLDRRTDIQALADEIVTTCKLIHHSKTGKVRALLAELRDRVEASSGAKTRDEGLEIVHDDDERRERRNAAGRAGARTSSSARTLSSTRKGGTATTRASRSRADDPAAKELDDIVKREEARLLSEARADFLGAMHDVAAATRLVSGIGSSGLVSKLDALGLNSGGLLSNDPAKKTNGRLDQLDLYLERLYDDDPKTRADFTQKIALLASDVSNLEALASHETLPQTLARVLREDGRRSADVAFHCLCVFFALSNASAFHALLLGNQVGDATLRVVDLELRRAADRRKLLKTDSNKVTTNTRDVATRDEDTADIADIDAFEARRVVLAEKKRDALLYVAFYALLNVAEDVTVERKMKKRDVCHYLMECVGTRSDVDLLVLCVTFLRKLSVRRENVEDMLRGATKNTSRTETRKKKEASDDGDRDVLDRGASSDGEENPDDVVSRSARFLADGDARVPDVLVSATLRLLLNLSFHERARDAMHERALLPRLCVFAQKKTFKRVALAALYNLSVDARRRRFFAVASPTAGTDLVLDALLETPDADLIEHACPIVAGLALNLSADARCAEALAARENGKPFASFLRRRLSRRDALGLKVARNVARFAGDTETCPSVWRAFKLAVGDETTLSSMLDCFLSEHPPGTDVALEALGLLADAHRPNIDLALDLSDACESRGVFEKIAAYVSPNETEDDAALEAVLFCLAFSKGEENAKNARFFVRTGIVESLYELLREKKDDDAFVLAVVSAFGAFLSFPETRDVVLNHTQTVFYLVELLRDECAAIRDAADAALDVVVDEAGEKWAVHVRRARFEAHNREWLDACGGGGGGGGGGDGSFDEHSGHSEPGGRAFDARRDGGCSAPVYDDRAEEDDMYGGY